jgi:SAM-dependent methyltransferase
VYEELLAGDLDRFFEPRRETCPVCGEDDLQVHLRTRDLLQQKPGRFTLERCVSCSHIFQNPRLSIEGLDFYYKDFYDGLGEAGMDFIFGYSATSYLGRARMLEGVSEPRKWLDVGGGHGHFCSVARDVWPETRFDGLDLSDSIDEAARRGWIDGAHRGLFPDLAPDMREQYDVVSMHHYLEHTREPVAEIEAAHTALAPGGHLLIELPDPESALGRVLGRYWIPWFQPQHQHLLSTENLGRILEDHGFTAVEWQRGQPHQRVDFMFAVSLLLDRLAPPTDRPWRRPPSRLARWWRMAVWTVGTPLVLLAHGLDRVLDPLVRRTGMSNTYRVLARRS